VFEGVLREAVHCLKYRYMRVVADPLAGLLVAAWHRYGLEADVIVPVPLHPRRVRERGYNQSQLLAERLATAVGVPVVLASLRRERYTASQTRLGVQERKRNVAGAFACTDDRLAGMRVLLVDDVCTSGSTLEACGAATRDGGARSVWALTVGRATMAQTATARIESGLVYPDGAEGPHPEAERREGNASHRAG
jgi:ComF family protein